MIKYNELPLRNFIVVGSRAFGLRDADDIDVLVYKKDILLREDELNTEYEYIYTFYHKGIRVECLLADKEEGLQRILEYEKHKFNTSYPIATIQSLYILKWGHLMSIGPKWEKHMQDFHTLGELINYNASYDTSERTYITETLKLHRECTKRRLKTQTPKLKKVNKNNFFNDNVVKYVDHDRIHEWMALDKRPSYTKMQKEGSEVECDKKLFDSMTIYEKTACVVEEARVIACERILIPKIMRKEKTIHDFNYKEIKDAYKWALMRICTTLTSGWFRDYAIMNYYSALNNYGMDFPSKIKVEELDKSYMLKLKQNEKNINN